jgi:zinc resistance-associated protein
MRRRPNIALKRTQILSRVLAVFAAVFIGYLIGGWNTVALRTEARSASDMVALRFPREWNTAAPAASLAAVAKSLPPTATTASAVSDAQLALFSPQPMIPLAGPQAMPVATQDAVAPVQVAVAEDAGVSSAPDTDKPPQMLQPARATPRPVGAARTAGRRRVVNRPGYMLDDAQIASIKERLELTPDQQSMWPAVEAALRNIAYTHIKPPGARGAPSDGTQIAAVDADSVEDLKSAATPLILSFSEEQKEQVRSIAHVMGLDQLASQF